MVMSIDEVLYTAHAPATGGRDGRAVDDSAIYGNQFTNFPN
jgi:hypothetical protein